MPAGVFQSHDPATGEVIASYADASDAEIASACADAAGALAALSDPAARVRLLRRAAERLRAHDHQLHELCHRETALPIARLQSELERTCVQLELFAEIVAEGSHVEAIIDTADPHAPVAARPDIRRMLVPLGPVAVFGASNFPYAFSVAGGDTASALAAGCPVVVKAHPSHPGTSELVAAELRGAVAEAELPPGAFSMVHGHSGHVGEALAAANEIEAVAFTGSLAGGRALFDAAAARARPIPVYAEMGSVNPVVITSGALRARGDAIAEALAVSVTAGTGQFCTKPGVVLVPEDERGDSFITMLTERLATVEAMPLLNARIQSALRAALSELDQDPEVERVTPAATAGGEVRGGYRQAPAAYSVDARAVIHRPHLLEERFGPVVLFVRCGDDADVSGVLESLQGQLTATVHAEADELAGLRPVVELMERRAGRLIFNGVPTGVAVTHAMHHGGPYPATSSPGHTSVGSTAIRRFQRPVAWQNAPSELLPAELRDENPLGIWRLVDGHLTREPVPQS